MLEIIAGADDMTAAYDQLVGQAKARGARDNITAVVARFRQAQSDSERGSAESADQHSEPEISRLKSTSDWPQQCVA
jgi:serine/threonine protein phosphatase PrpC